MTVTFEAVGSQLLSDFPEATFPCADDVASAYVERVDLGRKRMASSRVVICGLARSLGDSLAVATAARIEAVGNLFKDYRVVVYENDSDDGTLAALQVWARRNPRVTILTDMLGRVRYPQIRCLERAARMAEYRNRYREVVVESYRDYEYTIVVDTDLELGWSLDGFANTIGHDDWDAVGSNGIIYKRRDPASPVRRIHFDAWAFRKLGHPEPHEAREINPLVFQRGEPLVPVLSCFGGAAMYRTEAVLAAAYGGGDCEHVTLHGRMADAGFNRIFLNPSQIALYTRPPT